MIPIAHSFGQAWMGHDDSFEDPGEGQIGQYLTMRKYDKGALPGFFGPTGHFCGTPDQWLNGSDIETAPLLGWTPLGVSLCCLFPIPYFNIQDTFGGEDEGGAAEQEVDPFHEAEGGEDDGGSDGVIVPCCPDRALPKVLFATITDTTGCSCLSDWLGVPITLTYGPILFGFGWIGEFDVGCGPYGKLRVRLTCDEFLGWILVIDALESVFGVPSWVLAAGPGGAATSCDPLSIFGGLTWTESAGYSGDYCGFGEATNVLVTE